MGGMGMKRAAIAVALTGLVGLGACKAADSSVTGDGGQGVSLRRAGAASVCEQFVSRRLKAPGTADFRDPYGDQITYSGDGEEPITVSASVDSQNGFGAKLRSTYTCTVRHTSGDNWRLDGLNVNDGGGL